MFRPIFLNRTVETCNFDPLNLNQFTNGFSHVTHCFFFHFRNRGLETLHTPMHTFSIFGPPTYGFWSQSAREVSKSLKIGGKGVSSTLNVIF